MKKRIGPQLLMTLAIVAGAAAFAAGVQRSDSDSEGEGRAFLGVHLEEETEDPEGGARVAGVVPDSAAEKAGLRSGDVIQKIDDKVVRGPLGLAESLRKHTAGDRVQITVSRDSKDVVLDAELGDRSDALKHRLAPLANLGEWGERFGEHMGQLGEHFAHAYAFGDRPRLGVQLVELTPELREHLGGDREKGVLVSKVLDDMPAQAAGIRVGDLIVAVEDDEITDSGELVEALRERAGQQFSIRVIRDRRPVTLEVSLPDEDEDEADADGPRARYVAPPAPTAPVLADLPALPALPPPPPSLAPAAPPPPPAPPAAPGMGDTV